MEMEDLSEILTCAVCLDFFNSPRRLPCLHGVYCLECLRGLVSKETNILPCPECRSEHVIPDVERIPVDHRIIKFIEIQKKLYIPPELMIAAGDDDVETLTSCPHEKESICVKCLKEKKLRISGALMHDFCEFFTTMLTEENNCIILDQKKYLMKKKSFISVTRKHIDLNTEKMKEELDKRRDELYKLLDEEIEKFDAVFKKFDFMETVAKNMTECRIGLFEQNCSYEALIAAQAQLKDSTDKIKELICIGTNYKTLNSVSYDKSYEELLRLIHKFGELVESETTVKMDYNKKWEIISVFKEDAAYQPRGVTFNPYNGHIYAAFGFGIVEYDMVGNEIRRYETDDVPQDIVFGKKQEMIVTSQKDYNVKIYDCDGNKLSQFGSLGDGPSQFNSPYGVSIDSDGRLYVVDRDNKRIQVFNSNGVFINSIVGIKEKMDDLQFITVLHRPVRDLPRLFVTDGDKVLMIDVEGDKYTFIKDIPVTKPYGICQDKEGNILVASDENGIIVLDNNGEHLACINEPQEAFVDMNGIDSTDCGVLCVTSYSAGKLFFLHQYK